VNPAGRLPLTYPRATATVPTYYDHKPSADRAYLFEDKGPQWPFGHGLSYTTFGYGALKVSPARMPSGGRATVIAEVSNMGKRDGDEVVQLYIHDVVAQVTRPVMQLRGFQRVHLKAGQSKRVEFTIGPDDLSFYDRDMVRVIEPGTFDILIGASSADIRQRATLEIGAGPR
jgi:beta-glucosidase